MNGDLLFLLSLLLSAVGAACGALLLAHRVQDEVRHVEEKLRDLEKRWAELDFEQRTLTLRPVVRRSLPPAPPPKPPPCDAIDGTGKRVPQYPSSPKPTLPKARILGEGALVLVGKRPPSAGAADPSSTAGVPR